LVDLLIRLCRESDKYGLPAIDERIKSNGQVNCQYQIADRSWFLSNTLNSRFASLYRCLLEDYARGSDLGFDTKDTCKAVLVSSKVEFYGEAKEWDEVQLYSVDATSPVWNKATDKTNQRATKKTCSALN